MITATDLEDIPLLKELSDIERERLAAKAADIHLAGGEWLLREGEHPYFWVLLEGELSMHHNFLGRMQEMTSYGKYRGGDFCGEIPILLGCRTFNSIRADKGTRLARFEPYEFYKLIRGSDQVRSTVMATMTNRLFKVQQFMAEAAPTRVKIVCSEHNSVARAIRHFLTLNRIAYEWINSNSPYESIPEGMPEGADGVGVLVDGDRWMPSPLSVRELAVALGIGTRPLKNDYDVVIVGGGPAGLAASVYGASEGLNTLMVERNAAGGQAGTSTRIENYLGFPDGISGDDMSERALRQAERFGAEMVVTREVTGIEHRKDGTYCCHLDGGDSFISKTIILATGVTWRAVNAKGVDRLRGRGVLYGAAKTEAAAIIGKDVFIVGGGNSAGQAAVFFANYANSITILVRGDGLARTMSQYLVDQITQHPYIKVEPFTQLVEVEGRDELESILTVTPNGAPKRRKAQALFILIGATADTGWLPAELQRDPDGFVYTGRSITDLTHWKRAHQPYLLETSLPGFFCVGDVRHGSVKRISSAVGEGSMAITLVHQYLAAQASDDSLAAESITSLAASLPATVTSLSQQ